MKGVRIESTGQPGGTRLIDPDGMDLMKHAAMLEILVEPGEPVKAILTFVGVSMDMEAGGRAEGAGATLPDAVARHNATKL